MRPMGAGAALRRRGEVLLVVVVGDLAVVVEGQRVLVEAQAVVGSQQVAVGVLLLNLGQLSKGRPRLGKQL